MPQDLQRYVTQLREIELEKRGELVDLWCLSLFFPSPPSRSIPRDCQIEDCADGGREEWEQATDAALSEAPRVSVGGQGGGECETEHISSDAGHCKWWVWHVVSGGCVVWDQVGDMTEH